MQKIIFILSFSLFVINGYSQQTVGLFTQGGNSLDGYILFAPNFSKTTYLIDKCGYKIHSWVSTHTPGMSCFFLEDGILLRAGDANNTTFTAGGKGGVIEKIDWDGTVLWSYVISSNSECQHHDIHILPNGNVLAIVWELKSPTQAIAAGADTGQIGNTIWSDKILEIQPIGSNGGNIVWEWHAWDHLIQDFDSTKANYGVVADHPELINLNYNLGTQSDWLHCNGLDYNTALDQIILSSHNQNEFYIIDHNTSTAESSAHSGGAHDKGGDLLYRWGNPAAYNRGTVTDKKLFGQHNPHWIESGADSGSIMIFNNGIQRPQGLYSSVDIVLPPINSNGDYIIPSNQSYAPDSAYWSYSATVPTDFYDMNISGAQQLSNGNTLICEGPKGNFFEIDSAKNTVWKYVSPSTQAGNIISQGATPTNNSVFRCTLYEPNYSGFTGKNLTPGAPIELNPLSYSCLMIDTTSISFIPEIENEEISISNPFDQNINFKTNKDLLNATVILTDVTGRLVSQWNNLNFLKGNVSILNLNKYLTHGIYFIQIKTISQNISSKLIH